MNYKKYIKRIIIFVICYLIVGILIPLFFKRYIFENTIPSNLSNGEWASFLGSYAGGVLGGLGTLIAVIFTVKSSFVIQSDNKKDTDNRIREEANKREKELKQSIEHRDREKREEKENTDRRERQRYAETIADQVGIYITHISNYFYMMPTIEKLYKSCEDAHMNLKEKEVSLEKANKDLEKIESIDDEAAILSITKEACQDRLERAKEDYQRKLEVLESYKRNNTRLKANEVYFSLQTKLKGNPSAAILIQRLEEVQTGNVIKHEEIDLREWIDKKTEELMDAYQEFYKNYI